MMRIKCQTRTFLFNFTSEIKGKKSKSVFNRQWNIENEIITIYYKWKQRGYKVFVISIILQ